MGDARVRYQLAVSLDGLIGPPDGSIEWLSPYEDMAGEVMGPFLAEIGGIVMGRLSYELLRGFGSGPLDEIPTVVLTSNPGLEVSGAAEVCTDGPRVAVATLEERVGEKDIWLFGGGRTAGWFLQERLVDRIELTIVPVALGVGRPMFAGVCDAVEFEFVSNRVGPQGTVTTVYARAAGD